MTGLYPIHTGLQHGIPHVAQPWGLSPNFTIMPQYLSELGYISHIIGKWHLGYYKKIYTPTYRGFDSFYGFYNNGEDYYRHEIYLEYKNESFVGLDFWDDTTPVRDKGGVYATRLYTKRAISLIKDHDKNKPLFLYMPHQAVNGGDAEFGYKTPASAMKHFPYIQDLNRTMLAGAVYEMDQSIGLVIEALHKRNMLENSIVIFSTDNGGLPTGLGSNYGFNWPLRGFKATLWEGGVRGAAFIWSPLLRRSGRISSQMMHITDWLPTLYSAAGGDVSRLGVIDGIDMWEALCEDLPSPRHEILLNIDSAANSSALIVGNRKVFLTSTFPDELRYHRSEVPGGTRPVEGLDEMMLKSRTGTVLRDFYKVEKLSIRPNWRQEVVVNCSQYNPGSNFVANSSPYYFDIQRDPCELENLAAINATEVDELMEKLAAYAASMIPPANKPIDPRGLPKYNHGLWAPWE